MTGFTEKLRFSEGTAKTYMILGISVACLESLLLLELRFVSPKFESSKKFCEYFFALKSFISSTCNFAYSNKIVSFEAK